MISLELAGRGERWAEPLYETLEEAVQDLYHAIERKLGKKEDYILFGHSMGSLLAYELCHMLIEQQYKQPLHLFVSGGKAPHVPRELVYHSMSDEDFKQHILDYDESSNVIFSDKELHDFFMPVLRADFKIVETHQHQNKNNRLNCKMTALTGSEDKSLTLHEVEEWKRYTQLEFNLQQFKGGHFFLNEHMEHIVELIHQTRA